MNQIRRFTESGWLPAISIGAGLFLLYWFSLSMPLFRDPTCTVLEDRNGELMGARIADDGQWRFPDLDSVPYKYERCLLQYEDRFFYLHPGVNPFSLIRALIQDLRAGEVVSGGSTLTMQLARISRRGKPRTIAEKILEIVMATRIEIGFSKNEILALYSSHAPFGGNVVGLEAAAWRYFGRSAWQLTWSESAMLAVLPNSPALIHPGRNRDVLLAKRNRLLDDLYIAGHLDSLSCSLSKMEPLPEKPLPLPSLAPHLLDQIYLTRKGERIRSTLIADLQQKLNGICSDYQKELDPNEIHNLACLVLDTESGSILAYIGNTGQKKEHSPEVDIIQSARSTGSILKPLLYCLMLKNGNILPTSLVPDIPTQYTGYSPKNFSFEYDGAVPAKRALSRSLNIPAVRMLQSYGQQKFYQELKSMNMETLTFPADHYGLSLILGGAEGTLYWITGIYASLARILEHYSTSGAYFSNDIHNPYFILPVLLEESVTVPLSAASIWLTFQSLVEVNRPESQAGWDLFESSSRIAWKTGTSFGFRDAWAVGTCPEYTVGIWAGNADGEGRPGLTGITAAAPLLFDVFGILEPASWFQAPSDELFPAAICRQSGYLPGPNCTVLDTILVPELGLRTRPCPYHIMAHLTPDGRFRVNRDCFEGKYIRNESWFVLPPVQEWYFRPKNPSYRTLPGLHPDCSTAENVAQMEMIYPRHSARVYVPRELDGSPGKVILEAAHRNPETIIYWHLDENYLGSTVHIHQMGIRPSVGRHALTLVDQFGNTLRHHFEVVDR